MPEPVLVRGTLRVLGTGLAVPTCPEGPRRVITNEDLVAVLAPVVRSPREGQAAARMLEAAGARTRHWSHWIGGALREDEPTAADLACEAARAALADAGECLDAVQLLILALSTSTLPTIATSTPVAAALGYAGPSFDLKAGCAGSLYALHLASVLLASGYRRILVIGTDTMSRYLDPQALLGFATVGDGAGAVLLGPGDGPNFLSALWGEYGSWTTAGVFGALPPTDLAGFTFTGTPTRLKDGIQERYLESLAFVLDAAGKTGAEVGAWVPHQIAPQVLEGVRVAQGWEPDRVVVDFPRHGNTGSASLLMALHAARQERREGPLALTALGGGMRWGSAWWEEWA